jgi:hypothetical protein
MILEVDTQLDPIFATRSEIVATIAQTASAIQRNDEQTSDSKAQSPGALRTLLQSHRLPDFIVIPDVYRLGSSSQASIALMPSLGENISLGLYSSESRRPAPPRFWTRSGAARAGRLG